MVFPSLLEGFGVPRFEAMRFGAAVVGPNATSAPKAIGREDALFAPHSDCDIAVLVEEVLTDPALQESLRAHTRQWVRHFS